MKTVINLIRKEYILLWNDKVGLALTFIVPVILIVLFGAIFSGGNNGSASGIKIAFLDESNTNIGKRIESSLDTVKAFRIIKKEFNEQGNEIKFDTSSIKEYIRKGNATAALVIPHDALTDTSFGLKLKYYFDPRNQIATDLTQGLLQQTIMTQVPEIFNRSMMQHSEQYLGKEKGGNFNRNIALLVSEYFDVDTSLILNNGFFYFDDSSSGENSSGNSGEFFSEIIQIDSEQLVGRDVNNPNVTRSIGGWAIMFLLFGIAASGVEFLQEKKNGVTLRILTSPVSKLHILWSKYLYNISLGIIQILFLFFTGYILFNIDILSNFFNLFLIIFSTAVASTAFGMFLAAFCKTPAQINGLGTFLILIMSAIGGAWFPSFFLPSFIQSAGKFTIVYWSIEGFLQVLWGEAGTMEILPVIGILFLMAAVIILASVWRFKKGDIF